MSEITITKQEALDIMMLLSALESWGFCHEKMIPDYLHERLSDTVGSLASKVVGDKQ